MNRTSVWGAALPVLIVLAACGVGSETTTTDIGAVPAGSTTVGLDTTTTSDDEGDPFAVDGTVEPAPLEEASFSNPTQVDNPYYPLTPGTQIVLDGVTIEDDEEIPHQIIYTVSDLTKVIGGVEGVVVWILDHSDGELVEAEIAFFAQDDDGNVWHLGEYPEEYEDGDFIAAPAWIHGAEGAQAGIQMWANPQPDTDSYAQGWGPAVEWDDRGRVFEVGSQTCVQLGCYEDVLIIDEFSLAEPTFFQVKYYARGVGNVQVGWKGNDPEGERLGLIEFKTLSDTEMSEVREAVLALDAAAYERSEAYAATEPIVP